MKLYVRRKVMNKETWFELVNCSQGDYSAYVDVNMLEDLQKSGHEIVDLDAVAAEMARVN